ncbi:17417_t:CDS:2 [Funneliformis geosporum]|nr:17417_t:CDS:2 [Funneliformis geosporum]
MCDSELIGFFDLLFQATNSKRKISAIGIRLTSAGISVTGINMLASMD